ncbi:MAG: aldehyde dehydrogenase family protein, partial [Rhodospirillales bacterium]|nr:aldehyde dehydrogenase family protein [Rhodospirillales bacterium]
MDPKSLYQSLGLDADALKDGDLAVHSPVDGREIARIETDSPGQVDAKIAAARQAFLEWRRVPPPKRGELIRLFGKELRAHKDQLGELVTLENAKILEEGKGEVQEMIDVCDFALGL